MSIHAISGKPGGGKSLFGMKALVNELRTTHRYVVTNLAVKPAELAAYLDKLYGQTFDLNQRLTILDEEQTAKFWLYRGNGLVLPDQEKNDFSAADAGNVYYVPDNEVGQVIEGQSLTMRKSGGEGVCFILDELHLFFNAREWAKTGKAAIFYLSQHRKCNNDVIWITQHIENVDKQFRSLTQDFTYLRNYRQEKFMSAFQSLPWFSFKTFQSPVTATTGLMSPTETGRFLLDAKGLAACYDTAKGVGFAGNVAADTKKPRRGLPMWVLIAICAGLCIAAPALVIVITKYISRSVAFHPGKALGGLMRTNVPTAKPVSAVQETNQIPMSAAPMSNAPVAKGRVMMQDAAIAKSLSFVPPVPGTNDLTMLGYALIPGRGYMVILSDGRVLYSAKRQVMFIDENRCVVDGAWVYKKVIAPAPFPVAAAVATPSESRSPSPVAASRSVIPERRTRTMTIHFADGSASPSRLNPRRKRHRAKVCPTSRIWPTRSRPRIIRCQGCRITPGIRWGNGQNHDEYMRTQKLMKLLWRAVDEADALPLSEPEERLYGALHLAVLAYEDETVFRRVPPDRRCLICGVPVSECSC